MSFKEDSDRMIAYGDKAFGTRRSSSISADQVQAAAMNHRKKLPANPLIREEKDEEDSSEDQSDNGLSKLSSSNKQLQSD